VCVCVCGTGGCRMTTLTVLPQLLLPMWVQSIERKWPYFIQIYVHTYVHKVQHTHNYVLMIG